MFQEEEKVICAAIWYKNFPTPVQGVRNIDQGVVLCGHRHAQIIGQIKSIINLRTATYAIDGTGEFEQGFMTSKNRFLTRAEAAKMFIEAGGKPDFDTRLFSEDLY